MTYEIKLTPRYEREAIIKKRLENPDKEGEPIYDFRGRTYSPKVITLELNVPIYRMGNCRTFADQQSEIASKGLEKTYFSKGQELSSVQGEQHEFLLKLAKRGTASVTPIMDVLQKDGQREPILITHTGVVVNGNRRLCAMRELYRAKDGSIDARFSHVLCAVLPSDTTADEIDDIEADLQARPQTKLEYDWIGDAQLIRRQVGKGRTTKEVADRLNRTKADIENILQALDEADLYLSEWAEKPGQYNLVSGDAEQIFGDIPKKIANKDTNLQNASRVIAWSLFDNRDQLPGRIYSFNAAFGNLAPKVLALMEDQLDFSNFPESDDEDIDEDFDIDIDAGEGEKNFKPIIDALRHGETRDDAVSVLIEACETAIEREKGQKSAKAALKSLSQAHAKLMGVDVLTAGEATLPAMKKQVSFIRKALDKIDEKIGKRLEFKSKDS